jgi:competence protein ComEC
MAAMWIIKRDFQKYALLVLLSVTVFIWYVIFTEGGKSVLTVAFLDVGQGDAVFIEAPGGNQVLIDGGPDKGILRALSEVMPFYDRSINVVMATHSDRDHIGGLPEVLSNYSVDNFIAPAGEMDTAVSRELNRIIEFKQIDSRKARRGLALSVGRGVYLLILFPDRDLYGVDSNDTSLVAKLIYGNTAFLLTGDAPRKIEDYLVALDGDSLDIDVLKVGHHGSKTSTSDTLLGFASPEYAIISAGKDNRYGHPHQETIEKLLRFDVRVLETAKLGTIVFESDGEQIIKK